MTALRIGDVLARLWEVLVRRIDRPLFAIVMAIVGVGFVTLFSAAGQTKAAHELCTGIPKGRQFHYDVEGAGHYGIFSGRRWREKVYPEVRAFIRRFDVANTADREAAPVTLAKPAVQAKPATTAARPRAAKRAASA